jgi:hypothetical protein
VNKTWNNVIEEQEANEEYHRCFLGKSVVNRNQYSKVDVLERKQRETEYLYAIRNFRYYTAILRSGSNECTTDVQKRDVLHHYCQLTKTWNRISSELLERSFIQLNLEEKADKLTEPCNMLTFAMRFHFREYDPLFVSKISRLEESKRKFTYSTAVGIYPNRFTHNSSPVVFEINVEGDVEGCYCRTNIFVTINEQVDWIMQRATRRDSSTIDFKTLDKLYEYLFGVALKEQYEEFMSWIMILLFTNNPKPELTEQVVKEIHMIVHKHKFSDWNVLARGIFRLRL